MLYLFLVVNIIILIRTYFLNTEIQSLVKIRKIVKSFNEKNINERYAVYKLSSLMFEKKTKIIRDQIVVAVLFISFTIEYIYAFIQMFFVPFYPIAYTILCLWFFGESNSIKKERLILLSKIFCIIVLLNT